MLLELVRDEDDLWSEFGLRSLSKSDPFYGTGEVYWRGPVWVNMNYMALASLYKVSESGLFGEGECIEAGIRLCRLGKKLLIRRYSSIWDWVGLTEKREYIRITKGNQMLRDPDKSRLILLPLSELYESTWPVPGESRRDLQRVAQERD